MQRFSGALTEPPALRAVGGGTAPDPCKLSGLKLTALARAGRPPAAHVPLPRTGGDHRGTGKRSHSPQRPARTALSAPESQRMMISSLGGSAARTLDVIPAMQCAAAHAWRRMAVRSAGSIGAKDCAHLCSGQSQASIRRRSAPRRRPRGRILAAYKWTASGRRRFSSLATNLQTHL